MLETVLRLDEPDETQSERPRSRSFLTPEIAASADFLATTEKFWDDHEDVLPAGVGVIAQQATPSYAIGNTLSTVLLSDVRHNDSEGDIWGRTTVMPPSTGELAQDNFPPMKVYRPPTATLIFDARQRAKAGYLWELTLTTQQLVADVFAS